ncbi:hypothetical protein STEG23_005590 [Scotinomys teguina]
MKKKKKKEEEEEEKEEEEKEEKKKKKEKKKEKEKKKKMLKLNCLLSLSNLTRLLIRKQQWKMRVTALFNTDKFWALLKVSCDDTFCIVSSAQGKKDYRVQERIFLWLRKQGEKANRIQAKENELMAIGAEVETINRKRREKQKGNWTRD